MIHTNINKRSNFWMFPILLVMLYFGPAFKVGVVPVRTVDFFIILFGIIVFVQSLSHRSFLYDKNLNCFTVPVTIITLVAGFATLISCGTGRSSFVINHVFGLISFVRMMLIAAIVANIRFNSKNVNWLIRMCFVVLSGIIAISFIQKYQPYLVSAAIERFYFVSKKEFALEGAGSRVIGTFANPNTWSCGTLSIFTIAVSAIFFSEKTKDRVLGLLITILVIYCVMALIASRTGVFVCLYTLFLSFLLKLYCSRSMLSALLFAFIGMVLFFFLLFLYSKIQVAGRVSQLLSGEVSVMGELSKRYYFWEDMLEGIKLSPIWGIGIVKSGGKGQTADNGFLRVAYLSGLIGLVAYLWFYYKFFVKLFCSLKFAGEFRVLVVSSFLFLFVLLGYDLTIEPFISASLQGLIGVNIGLACAALNAISESNEQIFWENAEGLETEVSACAYVS